MKAVTLKVTSISPWVFFFALDRISVTATSWQYISLRSVLETQVFQERGLADAKGRVRPPGAHSVSLRAGACSWAWSGGRSAIPERTAIGIQRDRAFMWVSSGERERIGPHHTRIDRDASRG